MATTKAYATEFAILKYSAQELNDHITTPAKLEKYDILYLKFTPPTDGSQFYLASSANLYRYIEASNGDADGRDWVFKNYNLNAPFDPNTVTYATREPTSAAFGYSSVIESDLPRFLSVRVTLAPTIANGYAIERVYDTSWYSITTKGVNRPYLEVTVDPTVIIGLTIESVSPAEGAIIKTQENIFSWGAKASGKCIAEVEQSSAVFRWRSGTSGTIHTINVSGNTQSVTVPANTFAGTTSIQWQVAVTANSGVVTTSNWVTLSTADATPTAAPLSPVDTVLDGSKDVLFQWQHSISTGTAQSKADLQKKRRRQRMDDACNRNRRGAAVDVPCRDVNFQHQILARAHLQRRRHCGRVERCGADRCDRRADGSEYPDQVHRPAPVHQLADL